MKQQCYLVAIYLNWLVLLGGLALLLFAHHFALAIGWFITLPLAMWAYIRIFPSISRSMGYGKVDDNAARDAKTSGALSESTLVTVRLYTAIGCPFCPIVDKRLQKLQQSIGFKIEKIDVTLRPDLLAARNIRAVPVVEVADRRIQGNATSEQLANLISDARR